MKIYCVRIGDKYGPEYETYINKKLKDYEVIWIREPYDNRIVLQWNKMMVMGLPLEEPVCVIDIDILLINDYKKIFDYPIERGEFLSINSWWREHPCKINGGFFKYYPIDCNPIYDKFMKDPQYWQSYYIKNKMTIGPVNGEQNFVYDSIQEFGLKIKNIPNQWVTRWVADGVEQPEWYSIMEFLYNDWIFKDGTFNPKIKLVHFTNSLNKPHNWKNYNEFVS